MFSTRVFVHCVLCRPLLEELVKYAREDTHYLLYIYDRMKSELLDRGNNHSNLLVSVLDRSGQICLRASRLLQSQR